MKKGVGTIKDNFLQAKDFIFRDLERKIQLAKADPAALHSLGIISGGGNFLAAFGLLCYTEFGGKLLFHRQRNGRDVASENFNLFFNLLGQDYKDIRKYHNVYDLFRWGLAHEYYVKKNCTIAMLQGPVGAGLRVDESHQYCIIVESYCRDLKKAFDHLQCQLYGS